VAINHSPEAIAMHMANHPETRHYIEDIWKVDPVEACGGRPVDLMWLSPDCTHFSKAKGSAPKSPRIRGLAWIAKTWAEKVRPRVICLENVEEFKTWGPLDIYGRPVEALKGTTFLTFLSSLRNLGYEVDYRELVACDYGAPTSRKRFFLVARCDNEPIIWPTKTYGIGTGRPYRTAAECIDWSIPVPSIFGRKKELAEATKHRIAKGVIRYVVNNDKPFIVKDSSVCIAKNCFEVKPSRVDQPLHTITTQPDKHLLISAFLTKYHMEQSANDARVKPLSDPIDTLDGSNRYGLACCLMRQFGTSTAANIDAPMGTVMPAGEGKTGLVAAFLQKYYGNEQGGHSLMEPLDTITGKDRFALVTVNIAGEPYIIVDIGMRMLQPRELFNAQGFPKNYVIDPLFNGKLLSKSAQVKMVGNSVCPPVAAALVRANCQFMLKNQEAA
jgi:DNA (cytosine-5)-methyltransferase 1